MYIPKAPSFKIAQHHSLESSTTWKKTSRALLIRFSWISLKPLYKIIRDLPWCWIVVTNSSSNKENRLAESSLKTLPQGLKLERKLGRHTVRFRSSFSTQHLPEVKKTEHLHKRWQRIRQWQLNFDTVRVSCRRWCLHYVCPGQAIIYSAFVLVHIAQASISICRVKG